MRAESLTIAVDALVVSVGSVGRSTDLDGDASDIDLLMDLRNVDVISRSGEMQSVVPNHGLKSGAQAWFSSLVLRSGSEL